YGGTAYDNNGGLGVQVPSKVESGAEVMPGKVDVPAAPKAKKGELVIVPTRELYNRERVFRPSIAAMMEPRTPDAYVHLNAEDAAKLKVETGDTVTVNFGTGSVTVTAVANGVAPAGTALLPRHLTEAATPMTVTVGTVSKG
ncbi:MAG: molybdopterin dinucleotide binding domain-containing protein, partial [Chloroflexota bacterium]